MLVESPISIYPVPLVNSTHKDSQRNGPRRCPTLSSLCLELLLSLWGVAGCGNPDPHTNHRDIHEVIHWSLLILIVGGKYPMK